MSSDANYSHILLQWDYTPEGYFDEAISVIRDDHTLSIGGGKAEARVGPAFAHDRGMRARIRLEVDARFRAAQLLNHEAYELSEQPTVVKVRHDGIRDFEVEMQSAMIVISTGSVGVRHTTPDGTVIYDSRQQERDESLRLQQRVVQHHGDAVLTRLLHSYQAAVHDPNNELVHLYEMRDALVAHFGGGRQAQSALGITAGDWSDFGRLCNVEPLRQGRHRGSAVAGVRDATNEELEACRSFGRKLLQAYLDVLDGAV